jgi:hypothetical protein
MNSKPASPAPHHKPLVDASIDPEDDVQRVGAKLSDLHDLGEAGRIEATQSAARLDVFEQGHDRPGFRAIALDGYKRPRRLCEMPTGSRKRR